jgi:glycerophosphoryl diester phosphodiesterase
MLVTDYTGSSLFEKSEGEKAFDAGNVIMSYTRGVLMHERMNLDDAIKLLENALNMAVAGDMYDYVIKSQVQLASVHLKRYQLHGEEKDYKAAYDYSENLAQIAEEQNLGPGMVEALLLRAILKRTAKDVVGAKHDLLRAKALALENKLSSVVKVIDREIMEVQGLEKPTLEWKMDQSEETEIEESLDEIPGVFARLMDMELSRNPIVVPVKLYRLVVMKPKDGLPVYTYNFDNEKQEANFLVYGLLSAVTSVGLEIFPDAGRIRSLAHEGKTIIMEHEGEYMGALIAEKENFRARISLSNFLKGFIEICPPENWHGEVLNDKDRQEADFLLAKTFRDLALTATQDE